MRLYETVFIVSPELADEERQPVLEKFKGLVSGDDYMLARFDEWGHKKLAYEVKKQTRGYYAFMEYCGDGALVKELERNLRLDDRVLKYMTVLKEKAVDIEAIKEEIAAAKEKQAMAEAAEQATSMSEDVDSKAAEIVEAAASEAETTPIDTTETGEQEEQDNATETE